MRTTTEFFRNLKDGETSLNCFMTEEVFAAIPEELRAEIVTNEIRQSNKLFADDPIHSDLIRQVSKAKSKLRDYEFKINHKLK